MAIDTAQKRFSMISAFDFDVAMYVPNVSGISSSGERVQLMFGYGGFSADSGDDSEYDRRRRISDNDYLDLWAIFDPFAP